MIKVTYTYTNGVRELTCVGHAGYGGKAAREEGDPSGEAIGMTPHPSPPSAAPPSPQGEGLSNAAREEGDPGEAIGMTPHPSPPAAAPPSPQGEGLGGDIVCAAASALTGTLAAVLLRREVYLAPSEEGAVEGGGTPSETEGEITPTGAPQGVIYEDDEASSALSIRFRHDAAAERNLSLSLPPSSSASPRMPPSRLRARSGRGSDSPPGCHSLPRPPLRYLPEGGKVDISAVGGVCVSEAAGYCRITCGGAAAKPYFEFALVGLKKLAEAFPENVRVADLRESEEFH